MRAKVIWVIIVSCFIVTTGFSESNKHNKKNKTNFTKNSVIVNVQTRKAIVLLSSAPSTGYSWFIKSYPTELIESIDYHYILPNQEMPGAPGVAEFSFKIKDSVVSAPHLIPVVLTNARPWQPESGSDKTVWLIVTGSSAK